MIACTHGDRDAAIAAVEDAGLMPGEGIDAGDGVITPQPGPLTGPVNVWQVIDTPPLEDHAKTLAGAFGLDSAKTEIVEKTTETVEMSDGTMDLVVYSTGSYEYSRPPTDPTGTPPAAPTRDAAIALAKAFLQGADAKIAALGNSSYAGYALTPDQSIFIVSGAGVDMALDDLGNEIGPLDPHEDTMVMFQPALALQPPNFSLPVAGAEIAVTIAHGQVTHVRSAWRPVKAHGTIIPRTQDRLVEWLASLKDMVSSTVADLLPQYSFPNETDRVGFLAPVYAVPYSALKAGAIPPGAPGAPGPGGMHLKHGTTSRMNGVSTFPETMPATSWDVEIGIVGEAEDLSSAYHMGFEIAGGNWGVAEPDLKYRVVIASDVQGLVYDTQLSGSRMKPTCGAPAVAPPDIDAQSDYDFGDAGSDAEDPLQLPPACTGWMPPDGGDPFGDPIIADEVAPIYFDAYLPLTLGMHTLQVTVSDQNGNVTKGVFLAEVVRSVVSDVATHDEVIDGPATTWPISKMHRVGPVVVDVIPGQTLYPPRAAPIFKKFRRSNWDAKWGSVVDTIDMPQWRYHLMYELDYAKKYLYFDSSKCVSGQLAKQADTVAGTPESIGCGACDRPADITDGSGTIVKFAKVTNMSSDLKLQKFKAPTPLAGNIATNQTLDQFESSVTYENLPGTLEMKFKYQAVMTMCAPDYPGRIGKILRGANSTLGGAVRPMNTGLGRCEGLVPEVDWRYSFDTDGTDCTLLQKMCAIPAGQTTGPCRVETKGSTCGESLPVAATQADIDALCPAADPTKKLKVVRADVDIYTRYGFGGSRMNPSFIKDARTQAPGFDYTWGQQLIPDPGAAYKPGHPAVFIPPMPFETVADFRNPDSFKEPNRGSKWTTKDRHYDNIHIKQVRDLSRTLGNANQSYKTEFLNYTYPAFPGGNSQLTWDDQAPCFHLHEHWNMVAAPALTPSFGCILSSVTGPALNSFGSPGYNSWSDEVRYISVLEKPSERDTLLAPEDLVDDIDPMTGKLKPVDWKNPAATASAGYAEWKIGSPNVVDPAALTMHASHGGERIGPRMPYKEPSGKKVTLFGRVTSAVALSGVSGPGTHPARLFDTFANTDTRPRNPSIQKQPVAGANNWQKTHLAPAWASPDVMKGVFSRGHEIVTK